MRTFYKIVEIKNGIPYALFHGINRSRKFLVNKWITSEQKIVNDGGQPYLSGFHVFGDLYYAEQYLKQRFRTPKARAIVRCYAKVVWPKPTNDVVCLAERIKILDEDQDDSRTS